MPGTAKAISKKSRRSIAPAHRLSLDTISLPTFNGERTGQHTQADGSTAMSSQTGLRCHSKGVWIAFADNIMVLAT